MELPSLKIGDITAKIPIIQGGMGARISLSSLASAVANEGSIGIISAVYPGYDEPDFKTDNLTANLRGLKKEIQKARELSPNGIIGVNIMVAMNNYDKFVKAALDENIDIIISGAGLPLELPTIAKGYNTKLVPIVSSAKAALVISKMWDRKQNTVPDAIVVEGYKAGGHLGFSTEDLKNPKDLLIIVKEVKEIIKPFEQKYNKQIPVIAAGGIFDGKDIADALKAGADGVQMATRFVATKECDVNIKFKQAYINAQEEDVIVIKSPVGMPGRAIKNKFLNQLEKDGNIPKTGCFNCIRTCNPSQTPYCISEALLKSAIGDIDNGLIFAGSNVYKIKQIVTVKELIDELVNEAKFYLNN